MDNNITIYVQINMELHVVPNETMIDSVILGWDFIKLSNLNFNCRNCLKLKDKIIYSEILFDKYNHTDDNITNMDDVTKNLNTEINAAMNIKWNSIEPKNINFDDLKIGNSLNYNLKSKFRREFEKGYYLHATRPKEHCYKFEIEIIYKNEEPLHYNPRRLINYLNIIFDNK